jgi:flagellar assembly protein FliH
MISSSSEEARDAFSPPVTTFLYRDIGTPSAPGSRERRPQEPGVKQDGGPAPPGLSTQQTNDLVERARLEAVAETEARLKREYEIRSDAEAAKIRDALELFLEERVKYFARVESDVVQLSLAIAARILHREAQVDPLLVAALVRVAVDKLHDGSSVSVRIAPAVADRWRACLGTPLNGSTITITEDEHLSPDDCILETDLGSANFSIEAQLKEVEQGFFDLLAQRPVVK